MILPGFPMPLIMAGGGPVPVFLSAASNRVNASSMTIAKPAGVIEGDLLLAWTFSQTSNRTVTPPPGWTTEAALTTPYSAHVFSKVAGGSEPSSYVFTHSPSSVWAGLIVAYRQGEGVIEAVGSIGMTSSTTATAPAISPSSRGTLIGFFSHANNSSTISTDPSGMTQRHLEASNNPRVVAYDLTPSPGGNTGTKTVTWSSSAETAAVLLQIR